MSSDHDSQQPDTPEQIGAVQTRADIQTVPLALLPAQPTESVAPRDYQSGNRGSLYMPTAAEAWNAASAARAKKLAPQCKRCRSRNFWEVRSIDGVLLLQCVSCRTLYRPAASR